MKQKIGSRVFSDEYIYCNKKVQKFLSEYKMIRQNIEREGYQDLIILREGLEKIRDIYIQLKEFYNKQFFQIKTKKGQRKMFQKLGRQILDVLKHIRYFIDHVYIYYINYCQKKYWKIVGDIKI